MVAYQKIASWLSWKWSKKTILGGVGWGLRIDYKANSVQLLLQLPTGTELGNRTLVLPALRSVLPAQSPELNESFFRYDFWFWLFLSLNAFGRRNNQKKKITTKYADMAYSQQKNQRLGLTPEREKGQDQTCTSHMATVDAMV